MALETAHRPWPPPARSWLLSMNWHELLFMHWPVDPRILRPLVPEALELDAFDGLAWVGIVPFGMRDVRLRGCPPIHGTSRFPELNVRTYVKVDGLGGVFFWSLDAANRAAVRGARVAFRLPYFDARMEMTQSAGIVDYQSRRIHRGAPPAEFRASYRPVGEVYRAREGDLDHWLTERYCLYTVDGRGRARRAEIHHPPWPLQPAEAELECETMAKAAGISLPRTQPLLHYAAELSVVAWAPRRVAPGRAPHSSSGASPPSSR